MVRQFVLQQNVRLSGEGNVSSKHLSPDGIYQITRLMPEDQAGTVHYRIRSSAGELVLKEDQLVADTSAPVATEPSAPATHRVA